MMTKINRNDQRHDYDNQNQLKWPITWLWCLELMDMIKDMVMLTKINVISKYGRLVKVVVVMIEINVKFIKNIHVMMTKIDEAKKNQRRSYND